MAGLTPGRATISQVNLRVEWRVQTNASVIAILGVRARVTTTNLTIHENNGEPITLTTETFDITSERAWAPGDFRDGTLKTRLEPRNGNDASDPGYEFDYVAVEVVYTTTQDFPQTIAATQLGVATVVKATTFPRTVAATILGLATVATAVSFGQSIVATALGVATIVTAVSFGESIAAVAVGIVSMVRNIGKSVAATVIGIAQVDYEGPSGEGGGGMQSCIRAVLLSMHGKRR